MNVMNKLLNNCFIRPGTILATPTGRASFEIEKVSQNAIQVVVGEGRLIIIPAVCWEGIPSFLRGKGWVPIGAKHGNPSKDSLDYYTQKFTDGTSSASYIAPILEKAEIVEIDRTIPNKIRLLER